MDFLLVRTVLGEFRVLRYKKIPTSHLEEIDHLDKKYSLFVDFEDDSVFGLVTWILNIARNGEFDDVPVM